MRKYQASRDKPAAQSPQDPLKPVIVIKVGCRNRHDRFRGRARAAASSHRRVADQLNHRPEPGPGKRRDRPAAAERHGFPASAAVPSRPRPSGGEHDHECARPGGHGARVRATPYSSSHQFGDDRQTDHSARLWSSVAYRGTRRDFATPWDATLLRKPSMRPVLCREHLCNIGHQPLCEHRPGRASMCNSEHHHAHYCVPVTNPLATNNWFRQILGTFR